MIDRRPQSSEQSPVSSRPDYRQRVTLALLIIAVSWIWWESPLRAIFGGSGKVNGTVYESFNAGFVTAPQRVDVEGYHPCPDGWCLAPGKTGRLVYHIVAEAELALPTLWFYTPNPGTSRFSVSADGGQHYQGVSENQRLVASRMDLGIRVKPGTEILLAFDAVNTGQNETLVVDELKVAHRTGTPTRLPHPSTVAWIALSFGMAAIVLCRRLPLAISTLLILAYGASLRYAAAAGQIDSLLDPDAITFRGYIDLMRPFTETGFLSARFGAREPFFVLVAWAYGQLFGNSDFGLRLMSTILSTAGIWAVLRVGRRLFGDVPGQLIGLAVAVNAPLIFEASRGLRLDLEVVLCMAYFALAFLTPWKRVIPAAIAMSLPAYMLVMTRSTYLAVVLALTAYALLLIVGSRGQTWRDLLSWKAAGAWAAGMAVMVAILASGVVPHRYNMYKIQGDPYWDMAMYARWNANVEFAGQPGYLTMEELQKDAYVGPRITYQEYMFKLHTPEQLAVGTVRGYVKLFRYMEICPRVLRLEPRTCTAVDIVFQILAVVGFVAALWHRQYLWIPLAFFVMEFPVSFVFDRQLVEPYRHSYSSFPLVLLSASLTMVLLSQVVLRRVRGVEPAPVAAL